MNRWPDIAFFEGSRGATHSFDYRLSDKATKVMEWAPAISDFHHGSQADATAPSSKSSSAVNRASTNREIASSAHTGLLDFKLADAGSLSSAVTAESFAFVSGRPLPFLGACTVAILPTVGLSLLPLGANSKFESLFTARIDDVRSLNARVVAGSDAQSLGLQSLSVGYAGKRFRHFIGYDQNLASWMAFCDMRRSQLGQEVPAPGIVGPPLDRGLIRTGLGVVLKRDLRSGVNFWLGCAADLGKCTHVATQMDVLRRWSTSVYCRVPEWNAEVAARLRMNVITFKGTHMDLGVGWRLSDDVKLCASTTSSGLSAGVRARHGVKNILAPALSCCGDRGKRFAESLTSFSEKTWDNLHITAGVLTRYPQKPVLSGFLVIHAS